jgi:hypothetical protein
MEEKINVVSRWLVALTVIFIPLSIIILVSGSWGANFLDMQWTRYLLFASWIALTLSLIVGAGNMITFMAVDASPKKKKPTVVNKSNGDEGEDGAEDEKADKPADNPSSSMSYNLMVVQVGTFVIGVILYVAFVSWMILPLITLSSSY